MQARVVIQRKHNFPFRSYLSNSQIYLQVRYLLSPSFLVSILFPVLTFRASSRWRDTVKSYLAQPVRLRKRRL